MKRRNLLRLLISLGLSMAQRSASATSYDLFHPVPAAEMRELSTDRPDVTECPFTVDAGHFQLEMDLVALDRQTASGLSADSLSVGNFNFKLGLTDYADLQLGFEPWIHTSTADGNGDFVARLKLNFWGNNGGSSAFGVMPFIKAPAASKGFGNDATEGGVIFPLTLELPAGFGLGTMAEFDFNQNSADRGYHCDRVLSASLSHELGASIGCYLEYVNIQSGDAQSDPQQLVDFGFDWGLSKGLQLDLGANNLVAAPVQDTTAFIGLSIRI